MYTPVMPEHTTASIADFRTHLADHINTVQTSTDAVLVTSRGRPVAALISIADLKRLYPDTHGT